jgi:GntR family transcriptional regulator, rspAB operon transcriptional repressor
VSQRPRGPGRPWPAGVDLPTPNHDPYASIPAAGADTVIDQLRRAILLGDLVPGAWLRQVDLAAHFGVSRTPIREALRSLEREGLVRIVPNHGARVSPLSLADFEEIYALRSGIEGLAARKAAEAARPEDHALLVMQVDELATIAGRRQVLPYLRAEWSLRLACYRLTRRERLVATILHLRGLAERYLRLAFQEEADTRDSWAFHRDLVAAIGRNDGARAEEVNREALEWTLRRAWSSVGAKVESVPANEAGTAPAPWLSR